MTFQTARPARLASAMGFAAVLAGCVITPHDQLSAEIELAETVTAAEQSAPLGGEALSQRKLEMRRAQRDLVHFHATLEGLNRRRDRNGQNLFRSFLDAYLGTHIEPLVTGTWQSHHPELAAHDANLQLVKAELLILMRESARAQQVIERVAQRYEGHGDMIVEYPIGSQGTLQEALELLRERKWWRG